MTSVQQFAIPSDRPSVSNSKVLLGLKPNWSHVEYVTKRDGTPQERDSIKILNQIEWCTRGLNVNPLKLVDAISRSLYTGISTKEINRVATVEAGSLISLEEPYWTFVAARFVIQELLKVATNGTLRYPHLREYLNIAVAESRVNPILVLPEQTSGFDLDALDAALIPQNDFQFDYLGIQTLADRYLLRGTSGSIIELPQHMMMRVAMGLALAEPVKDRTAAAIAFYNEFSKLNYLPSTPTLFNSGTVFPQLSSCFGTNTYDSLESIMGSLSEHAQYSKFSGGTSTSYSALRSSGSPIRSTGGKAKGPLPYAKLFNDLLNAFDQGGKRKGVGAYYIEVWHPNIFEVLKARDPGGDARSRTHDAFPATWIPDLFMERVINHGTWSLIDPAVEPRLTETYGAEFEELYTKLEQEGKFVQQVDAETLWNQLLTKIFQQGTFWPCFKDEINIRYGQRRSGVVHHSNLCTEITLLNNETESFVCNLSSPNLANFKFEWIPGTNRLKWNPDLERTVRTAVRGLDNVIDIGFIPHENGRRFQENYRAVGLGVMGWAVCLTQHGIDFESTEHVRFANEVQKQISITAMDESANLAQERGEFPKFAESDWALGVLPQDTVRKRRIIEEFDLDLFSTDAPFLENGLDTLREKVKKGMRNSSLMAIAPTATIANIAGTSQCTEPAWDLVQQKENLSGTFDYVAPTFLYNPSGLTIRAARDIDQIWIVCAAAARQLHIDQSQSTNIYVDPNRMSATEIGDYLDDIYVSGYEYGMKTFYYCYSQSGVMSSKVVPTQPGPSEHFDVESDGPACFLRPGDPGFDECEACQ
jgi:ribonucleoside-diphosphate reductase alpha chain